MYSKERGYTDEPPIPRRLSYRQPDRPRMQVPPNYSGHAIVDGEERPLGQTEEPVAPDVRPESPPAEGPIPRFDDLPRVSELGESRYRPPTLTVPLSPYDVEDTDIHGEGEPAACEEGEERPAEGSAGDMPRERDASPHAPSSLFDLSRFPFGHGIGWEELFIMGLIWLLLHETAACGRERGDLDETVILLGLLLLWG